MPRVSRKQAEQHRKEIIAAAARLFRKHGIDGISLPGVMAEAGLTHGAFYGHFASKEALAAEACKLAFEQARQHQKRLSTRHGSDTQAMRGEFIARYTSKPHRDNPGTGCPAAALASDVARTQERAPIRDAFAEDLEDLIGEMSGFMSPRRSPARRSETLASVAMLVGAIVRARATTGHPVSDDILNAVRKTLDG